MVLMMSAEAARVIAAAAQMPNALANTNLAATRLDLLDMNHSPLDSDFSKSHHADKSSQHACLGRGGYKWRVRRFADDGVASISVPPFVRGAGLAAHSRYEPFRACFFFFGKALMARVTTENHPISSRAIWS